jgi:spermidine synthase
MDIQELAGTPATAIDRAAVGAHSSAIVPLFAATMFLSGFLLFMVEPMVAKMVLPILGGVPMVWNGCVVFFQIVMLAGYGYAFGASRWLRVRHHVLVHAIVLASPAAVLPFVIQAGSATPPDGNPILWLLVLLAGTIGLPFFVLSTSASVFQHWLSRTDHPAARDPYFLYGASNLGCLLALASYPVVVEPMFTLREQSRLWTTGYAEFVLLAAACGAFVWRRSVITAAGSREDARDPSSATPIAWPRRARWIALAFVPSSLMLAVTSYISTDVGAVPLLWIIPLALYLLTFVVAFGRHSSAAIAFAKRAMPLLVVPLAIFLIAGVQGPLATIVTLHLAAFAAIALYCHADLATDRPEAARLTEFYFWLSFGGMLGGLFNALAAPVLFNSIAEYPLVVALACVLFREASSSADSRWRAADVALPLIAGGLTVGILAILSAHRTSLAVQLPALAVPAVLAFTQRRRQRFGWCIAAVIVGRLAFGISGERVLFATRTFFGVYRVSEDMGARYHELVHGTTQHGLQALAPERRMEALTYYHESGPFGQTWKALAAGGKIRDIAVVGLGAGTLATYAQQNQRWTFFEIDPVVERIARTRGYFSFLEQCGARCRVTIGDARVSLGRVPERSYDLLVLDAFSSDSIPMHLMTREAFTLYMSRLTPNGVLALHISNRHLRLAPVVARLAESHRLAALQEFDAVGPGSPEGKEASQWVVMARTPADLGPLTADRRWSTPVPAASTPLWTDDFSNILSVLSVR